MKFFIKRYATARLDPIGFVKIGSDDFRLLKKDNDIICVINGCEVFKDNIKSESISNISNLIAKILEQLCNKNAIDQISLYKKDWNNKEYPFGDILQDIIGDLDTVKVSLKTGSKSEFNNFSYIPKISSDINYTALSKNLDIFKRKTSNAIIVLSNALKNYRIITGRKLVASMWGAKKTQKYLNNKNKKVASLDRNLDVINMHKELINKAIPRLSFYLKKSSLNKEQEKLLSKVIIPDFINNYESVKEKVSSTILDISSVLNIDKVFKENTRYPASWFISEETLDNINEDFSHLASFINDIPLIESKIIIPLDILRSEISK